MVEVVSSLPLNRDPRFVPGSLHVGFVVHKVALGQTFSEFVGFFLSISFHEGLSILILSYEG
jgi:hypothetical protein